MVELISVVSFDLGLSFLGLGERGIVGVELLVGIDQVLVIEILRLA